MTAEQTRKLLADLEAERERAFTHYPEEHELYWQDDFSGGEQATLETAAEIMYEWLEENGPSGWVEKNMAAADGPGEWLLTYEIRS